MRYIIKKKFIHNNQLLQQVTSDDVNEVLPRRKGWGEVQNGWYSEIQIMEINEELRSFGYPEIVISESTERRIVEDKKAREIIVESFGEITKEDWESLNGITLSERVVDEKTEYYYVIPAIVHTEFFISDNYYLEVIDTQSVEYASANYALLRAKEYPSINDMTVALWESVVENRHESKNALQAQRQAVKAKYPKPN